MVEKGCLTVFGFLEKKFLQRYDACSIVVEYKEKICKFLQTAVHMFTLGFKNLVVGAQFLSFKFTYILLYKRVPEDKRCLKNWDIATKTDEGLERTLKLKPGTDQSEQP